MREQGANAQQILGKMAPLSDRTVFVLCRSEGFAFVVVRLQYVAESYQVAVSFVLVYGFDMSSNS